MEPDTSKLERLVSDTERSIHEKKDVVMHKIEQENENLEVSDSEKPAGAGLPPTEALKRFFDRIPLFSVPGIGNAGVLELNMRDTISAAVEKLYVHKVLGAPVRDPQQSNNMPLTDQYVGLLDFASLVLWVLEEFEAAEADAKLSGMVLSPTDAPQNATASVEARNPGRAEEHVAQVQEQLARVAQGQQAPPETTGTSQRERQPPSREGFFGLLDKLPSVNSTQVSAMARSFRWGPFLPVRPEDTLLHVLLLLSKHRLKAVPVVDTESSNSVRGFITQDVAVQLLLQCEGLHWFETIAESTLSNAGFETERNAGQMVFVHGDDSLMKALRAMWKYRISGIPILDRSSKSLIGNIRYSDVRIVLDKPQVFLRRKEMSTQEFMSESKGSQQQGALEPHQEDFGTAESAAALSLDDIQTAAMQDPVTFAASETMKEAMQKLFRARSDRGFIVDTNGHVTGVVTLRDILMKFAPPIADAVPMGGFFDSALQQTGAFMGPGSVVTVHQN